jgi:hypothetical protein
LDPFHADLALCIGACEDHPLKRIAKYVWEIDEPEDWSVIWDEVGTDWRKIQRDLQTGFWGGIEGPGSGAIVSAFRYLLKKRLIENDLVSQYDTFVITRSDHMYVDSKFPTTPGFVHIPTGQNHGGVCDRFMVIDAANVIPALSMLEYINGELPDMADKTPERMLKELLDHAGLKIKRFRRNMFLVARKDEQTRWRKGRQHLEDDLYLKYPAEYDEAQGNWRHKLRCVKELFIHLYLNIRGQR